MHLSMRPSAHHPHHPSSGSAPGSSPFPYGAASPAEFASNLQHLQHLHSVQQQIATAAAAFSYWTSLKSSALAGGGNNNGTQSGRDGPAGLDHSHQHLPWRYDQHESDLVRLRVSSSNKFAPSEKFKKCRDCWNSFDCDKLTFELIFIDCPSGFCYCGWTQLFRWI